MKSEWKFISDDEFEGLQDTVSYIPDGEKLSHSLLESIAGIYETSCEGTVKHPDGKVVTIPAGTKVCVKTGGDSLVYEAVVLSVLMGSSVVDLKPGATITLIAT